MAEKSYLKRQIRLVALNANDLFTNEEYAVYMEICALMNEIDKLEADGSQPLLRKDLIAQKKSKSKLLTKIICRHKGVPRVVRLESVLKQGEPQEGATWKRLKFSRKICEFESEMSRAMGLKHLDYTFDKIIIKWKNVDLLEQLVVDGFVFPILTETGLDMRKYRCYTASSGQLRTDKVSFISETMWDKIHGRIECGMTWDEINKKGGVNVNKLLPYLALASSGTDPWDDFDIDRSIVIPDWESEVTDNMMYIKPDYTTEVGIRTVVINHIDGAGMVEPKVSKKNFMVRGPWCKGLLCSFPVRAWCIEHNVEPVIADAWGKVHNLEEEDIVVIFTCSQLKLWKYYDDWDHYKREYKKNNCHFSRMKYEEDYLPNKELNYQFIQSLCDFTDSELKVFLKRTHDKLQSITKDKQAMLELLRASPTSADPYNQALYAYPELLRDGYARETLKDTRKKMLYDAKAGSIRCLNKRVFAIPDLYAACEFYFLHDKHPKGLLKNGEIACKPLKNYDKADVLRSPHLYFEHAVRTISHDPEVYKWFYTDGVYTSCHDLISRILQMDVDGDELNVVVDPTIISVAERNIKENEIVPLFYDANKAAPEIISRHAYYHGLIRAHTFSNIGEISNMLTCLWNRNHPDLLAAALLAYLNNLRIDGAKNGTVNEYTNYPEIAKRINKATGGTHGRLPAFFKFTKNGRAAAKKKGEVKYAKPNKSTMNRVCAFFDDIGKINVNLAGVPAFNPQMLLDGPVGKWNNDIVQTFGDLDGMRVSIDIVLAETAPSERSSIGMYQMLTEEITNVLTEKFGSLEVCYPHIASFLFTGDHLKSASHKRMFWRVFGEIALRNLKNNLEHYTVCKLCGAKIPSWADVHNCPKNTQGFYTCIDCGKQCNRTGPKQKRCDECQEKTKIKNNRKYAALRRQRRLEYEKQCITLLQSCSTQTS